MGKLTKKTSKRWDPKITALFKETYNTYLNNQRIFSHPKATPITQEHWDTIAWNTAWYLCSEFSKMRKEAA